VLPNGSIFDYDGSICDTQSWRDTQSWFVAEKSAGNTLMNDHHRQIGPVALLFISVGGILGSGWLFGPLYAVQLAGPAALVAWVIGGLMVMVIALTFAELGAMLPINGGITRYSLLSYGRTAGFVASLASWLTFTVIVAAEVQAVIQYASIYFPWLTESVIGADGHTTTHPLSFPYGFFCAAVLWIVFSLINWRGVKLFARINSGLTWVKIVLVVLVTVSLIVIAFRWDMFDDPNQGGFFPNGVNGIFRALSYGGVVYAFTGFQHAAIAAGESKNPHRDVPIAVIASILFCMVCYIGLQIAFLGGLRHANFPNPGNWQELDFPYQVGPIAGLVKAIGAVWLFYFVFAGALISPLGAGLINLGSSVRIARGMSHDRYLPRRLSRLGHYRSPGLLIVLSFPIGLFLFLPFPGWQDLVCFLTSVVVIAYSLGPLSVVAFRRQLPHQKRPFRLPWTWLFCPLAFVICGLLIYWSGWSVVWKLGLIFGVCGTLFVTSEVLRGEQMDILAAAWIPPFLGGLVLITWLGGHDGIGKIAGWQGSVAVALWSLICYFLARPLALRPEQTQVYFDQIEAALVADQQDGT
jgi:amino acid transporter